MFKVTNETFGEIQINKNKMGYKSFILVSEIDAKIKELQENKIVKIKLVEAKTTKIVEKTNKKKNKEV